MQEFGSPSTASGSIEWNSHSETNQPYVQCRDLFKIFKPADLEVVALRGVDLDIEAGELMAVGSNIGSNLMKHLDSENNFFK